MNNKKLLATTIAVSLATGTVAALTSSVYAADEQRAGTNASSTAPTMSEAAENDLIRVSEDARTSMRDVHGARLAIFNGEPDEALTYVDAAVSRIDAAVNDADRYALDSKAPKSDDSYVPFSASLTVLNTFEPTPEKAKHIANANAHLHKGNKREAIEALKLADVDVAIATSMVPVNFAKQQIDQAAQYVADQKYYEANLALKAVDDSVFIETYAVDAVPKKKAEADN